jgi:adenosylcobinamide-GDP ribazoletransferase
LGFIQGFKNVIGFLTIFPIKPDQPLSEVSKYVFMFPIVGFTIGSITGLSCYLIKGYFPDLIVGTIGLGILLFLTGLHHTDGLFDLGDGLMFKGTALQKVKVMRDSAVGTGGLILGFIVLIATLFSLASLQKDSLVSAIIIAETNAKFALVLGIWISKPIDSGTAKIFIDSLKAHKGGIQTLGSSVIGLTIAILLGGLPGVIAMVSVLLVSLLVVGISIKEFNGVSGDVLGAINEISRLVSLTVFLVA